MIRVLIILWLALGGATQAADSSITVGIEGQLEVVLPVAELQAIAPRREAPITVRIAASTPGADGTHYDLRYIGLIPGKHDLRPCLINADGSAATSLPPLDVEIKGLLSANENSGWIDIPVSKVPILGVYRGVLLALAILWLVAAYLLFRRRKKTVAALIPVIVPPTLPERLRPLVEQAVAGQLSLTGKAELERLVLGHWSEKLELRELHPAVALARLREHPQAGILLRALEDWLHRRPGSIPVNFEPLLAAYAPVHSDVPSPAAS